MDALPFATPLYVTLKPAGSSCNLACRYCYYRDKAAGTMDDRLLETFIRQYIEAQTTPQVLFIWHGGEPLLRPIAFYERALQLQQRYARGRQIDNCLQTNGTLLTDEWCRFLREHGFLVGVSVDGPEALHDVYRRSSSGKASWREVMRGIALLQRHGVEWNAMAVVHDRNAAEPLAFYRFFRDVGCRFLQFTPIVERRGGRVADFSVRPAQWGQFLCAVYDEWARRDVGHIYVRLFEDTLAGWMHLPTGICTLAPTCGQATVIDAGGNVYSCDHFVFPRYRLGNIRRQTLVSMVYSEEQRVFGQDKRLKLPRQCRECRFLFVCNGECPKNRFATDSYGEAGLNYLCPGYRQYFAHTAPDMDRWAKAFPENC